MRRLLARGANVALSVLAGLGVLCVVVTLAGLLFDVRPLVFTSGSMSPTIDTGALGLSRPADAADLEVGDVVSVTADDSRVTHRITDIEVEGDEARLVLKGDGNTVEDAEPYTVTSADRVFFHVPMAGYVVNALSGPVGIFLGGMLAAGLLYLVFRPTRREEQGPDHSRQHAVVLVLALVGLPAALGLGRAETTWAAWADPASATSGGFAAHTVASQARPSCSNEGGVIGLLGYARLTWAHVDARYEYAWTAVDVGNGNQVGSGVVTPTGGAGSTVTLDIRIGLLNLGLGGRQVDITIRSRLKGATTWQSGAVTVNRVRTEQVVLGINVRCGATDDVGPTIGFTAPTNGITADAGDYRGVVRSACGSNRPACGRVSDESGVQSVSYQMKRVMGSSTEYFYASTGGGGIWNSDASFYAMDLADGVWSVDGIITTAYFDWNRTMSFTLTVRAVDGRGNQSSASINFTLN